MKMTHNATCAIQRNSRNNKKCKKSGRAFPCITYLLWSAVEFDSQAASGSSSFIDCNISFALTVTFASLNVGGWRVPAVMSPQGITDESSSEKMQKYITNMRFWQSWNGKWHTAISLCFVWRHRLLTALSNEIDKSHERSLRFLL